MILLLTACIPYNAPPPTPPTEPSENTIGPEGGTISVGDVELDIPEGALDEPVEIRIVDLGVEPPELYEGLSTVWSFEPEGLTFAEPVTVHIPYDEHALPQLYWSEGDDYVQLEDVVFEDGLASASIEHFSTAFVAITPIEVFEEPYQPPQADFLFVIDNSCSMADFQHDLADQMPGVFDVLITSGLDYHIGVVSTDMEDVQNGQGKLQSVGTTTFIDPATPDPTAVFAQMANMGTTGYFEEKGRAAAFTMVELKPNIPRNQGFYRPDASMDFVFLSDEEDQSGGNPVSRQEFLFWMHDLKPTPEQTRAHSIVQLPAELCELQGSAGTEYQHYANETGGELVDMCQPDWSTALEMVVEERIETVEVELPVEPSEVVSVRFAGVTDIDLEPAEYTLDVATLRFDQGVVPVLGDTIEVRYRP